VGVLALNLGFVIGEVGSAKSENRLLQPEENFLHLCCGMQKNELAPNLFILFFLGTVSEALSNLNELFWAFYGPDLLVKINTLTD
jgi:hypothetical protein